MDKSQTTEGATTDEEAGSRPLLDDDELENEDYEVRRRDSVLSLETGVSV